MIVFNKLPPETAIAFFMGKNRLFANSEKSLLFKMANKILLYTFLIFHTEKLMTEFSVLEIDEIKLTPKSAKLLLLPIIFTNGDIKEDKLVARLLKILSLSVLNDFIKLFPIADTKLLPTSLKLLLASKTFLILATNLELNRLILCSVSYKNLFMFCTTGTDKNNLFICFKLSSIVCLILFNPLPIKLLSPKSFCNDWIN